MKRFFIPIIGTISSGKSTFLNGFLGINNILQTGSTTTTQFICLIQNSQNFCFYHVCPKKENNIISFIKEGEETKTEDEIKERIKEINKNLSIKNGTIDEIFYILEIPIKNIENDFILENCYFMDIPGLNEGDKTYIEDIFNLININDILFEIIVFDSTSVGSDNILNIFNSLYDKKALKKTNNLFILNKIDLCPKDGEENILETFKKYFYKTFEEGQTNENSKININIYKNFFIPMNSLLYLSETKLNNDFNSFLVFELFNYLKNYNRKFPTFYEYIKNKLDFLIRYEQIGVIKENKKIEGNVTEIIKNSIEYLKNIYKGNPNVSLGFNKKSEKDLKNMYTLYKLKKYPINHSDCYNELQEVIKKIKINIENDINDISEQKNKIVKKEKKFEFLIDIQNTEKKANLSLINIDDHLLIKILLENNAKEFEKELEFEELIKLNKFFKLFDSIDKIIDVLKEIFEKNNPKIYEIENGNLQMEFIPMEALGSIKITLPQKKPDNFTVIEQLNSFLNKVFDEIDKDRKLKNFRISLQTLTENISGKKIRISLIGNISVGKSTVLNCIIGEKLLPTKSSECTYRGVILRYKNEEEFKLYKTKLISKGVGKDEYYFFEKSKKPHCKGAKNIMDYLKNKNDDENIKDEDAYMVITGRLKIFKFLKLDEKIIRKIEFIDLPGNDRKDNIFNKKEYYKKILKFSNCCIYINEPKSIKDNSSIQKMINQYSLDKLKVFPNLREQFIKTCIFLINKSDILDDNKEKYEIKSVLMKTIKSNMEPNANENEINISFFSAKKFENLLEIQKNFIDLFENNQVKLFKEIHNKWYLDLLSYNFKNYIINRYASGIEEKFDLNSGDEEEEEKELEIPENLKTKLLEALNGVKGSFIDSEDKNEIIEVLYSLYDKIKNKNFNNCDYSKSFFDTIRDVILFSDILQTNNLNLSIAEFLSSANSLFAKKIKQEEKESKEKLSNLKQNLEILFLNTEQNIKNSIENERSNCMSLIMDEINNCDNKLKEANNDEEKLQTILSEKIKNIFTSLEKKIEKEIISLNEEMKNLINKIQEDIKINKINENTKFENQTTNPGAVAYTLSSTISSIASLFIVDSLAVNISIFGSMSFLGLAGIFGVITAGITLGGLLIYKKLNISNHYKESLKDLKQKILEKFFDIESGIITDFNLKKDTIINKINTELEIQNFNIDNVDENKWKEINKEYLNLKVNISSVLNMKIE